MYIRMYSEYVCLSLSIYINSTSGSVHVHFYVI